MKRNSEELRGPAPEKRPMISGLKVKSADFYLPSRGYRILCKNEFLAKTSVSPGSSPLGTFREEERLRLSGRNSILMTQINVYIINPVVMGFQIQICPIFLVDFGKVLCSSANELQQNLKASSREEYNYSTKY